MSKCLLFYLLLFIIACTTKSTEDIYYSRYVDDYNLNIIDSLVFYYKDSLFIGRVHDIQFYEDKILISDFFLKKLWVFTKDLRLIKTVGSEGRGPGEYSYAPNIFFDNDFIWLYFNNYIDKYTKEISFLERIKLPVGVIYKPNTPLATENFFIFNIVYPFTIADKSYFEKYKPLIAVKKSTLKIYKNFDDWDGNYYDDNLEAYSRERHEALVTKKDKNHFFAIQGASFFIKLFDDKFNVVKHFGRKPLRYKNPPKIKFKQSQASVDANAEFYSNITIWHNLKYDQKGKLLCIGYTNLFKDFYLYRSLMRGKHYLQIYDQNYNVIFDGEIPGKLAFVDNGNIYIVNKEDPSYLKLLIYRLVKKVKK